MNLLKNTLLAALILSTCPALASSEPTPAQLAEIARRNDQRLREQRAAARAAAQAAQAARFNQQNARYNTQFPDGNPYARELFPNNNNNQHNKPE